MDKLTQRKKMKNQVQRCEFSGESVKGKPVVLVKNAILYVKKMGYLVSNMKFMFFIFVIVYITTGINAFAYNNLDTGMIVGNGSKLYTVNETDPHSLYKDGSNSMSGDLDLSYNDLLDVGNYDTGGSHNFKINGEDRFLIKGDVVNFTKAISTIYFNFSANNYGWLMQSNNPLMSTIRFDSDAMRLYHPDVGEIASFNKSNDFNVNDFFIKDSINLWNSGSNRLGTIKQDTYNQGLKYNTNDWHVFQTDGKDRMEIKDSSINYTGIDTMYFNFSAGSYGWALESKSPEVITIRYDSDMMRYWHPELGTTMLINKTGAVTANRFYGEFFDTSNIMSISQEPKAGYFAGDGVTSGAQSETNVELAFNDSSFTICAWINVNTSTASMIVNKRTTGVGYQLFMLGTTGDIRFNMNDGDNVVCDATGEPVNETSWRHVCAVLNKSNDKAFVYIDGINYNECDFSSIDKNIVDDANTLKIGYSASGQYFPGYIDEVMLFNDDLSSGEINQTMNNGLDFGIYEHNNLKSHYSFDYSFADLKNFNHLYKVGGGDFTGESYQRIRGDLRVDGSSEYLGGIVAESYADRTPNTKLEKNKTKIEGWLKNIGSKSKNERIIVINGTNKTIYDEVIDHETLGECYKNGGRDFGCMITNIIKTLQEVWDTVWDNQDKILDLETKIEELEVRVREMEK